MTARPDPRRSSAVRRGALPGPGATQGGPEPAQVSLWLLRPPPGVGQTVARLAVDELDDAEQRRAQRFVRSRDGVQYLVAHLALRRLLAARTGCPPARLRFAREACALAGGRPGRPVLEYPAVPVQFSLSHSHGLVLIGIAAAVIGVDVQRIPTLATVDLCLDALHPQERRELGRVPAERRPSAFAQVWSRKEAYLKGLGTGLRRGLARDYLGHGNDPGSAARPSGWTVCDVPAGPRHTAAVAVSVSAPPPIALRVLRVASLYAGGTSRVHSHRRRRAMIHDRHDSRT